MYLAQTRTDRGCDSRCTHADLHKYSVKMLVARWGKGWMGDAGWSPILRAGQSIVETAHTHLRLGRGTRFTFLNVYILTSP